MFRLRNTPSTLAALGITLLFGAACGTAGITNPTNGGNGDPNYIYGGSGSGSTSGGTVDPSLTSGNQNVAIGFELSNASAAASAHPASDTNFWLTSARTLAAKVPSSTIAARLVVGTYSNSRGSVEFAFPRPQSTTTRNSSAVSFDDTDAFDSLLTALDGINASVVLEAQPGYADLTDLADAMYAAYGTHKSVTGLSFDLSYYRSAGSLNDSTAQQLVAFVAGKNANLSVEVRSSDTSDFPSNGISGLTYVYDTVNRTSLSSITAAEKSFASSFANSPIKFIVGASGQRGSVCAMTSPEIAMLTAALQAGNTVRGVYWSSSTVATLSPGTGFACSDTSNSDTQTGSSSSNNNSSSNNTGASNTGSTNNGSSATGSTNNGSASTGSSTPTGSTGTGSTTGTATGSTGSTGGSTGSTGTSTGTGSAGTGSTTGSTGTGATTGNGASSTGAAGTTGSTGSTAGSTGTSTGSNTGTSTGQGSAGSTSPSSSNTGSSTGGATSSTPGASASAAGNTPTAG